MRKITNAIKSIFSDENDGVWGNIVGLLSFFAAYDLAKHCHSSETVWPFIAIVIGAFSINGAVAVVKVLGNKSEPEPVHTPEPTPEPPV